MRRTCARNRWAFGLDGADSGDRCEAVFVVLWELRFSRFRCLHAGMFLGSMLCVLAFVLFSVALVAGAATLSMSLGEHAWYSSVAMHVVLNWTSARFGPACSLRHDCHQLGLLPSHCWRADGSCTCDVRRASGAASWWWGACPPPHSHQVSASQHGSCSWLSFDKRRSWLSSNRNRRLALPSSCFAFCPLSNQQAAKPALPCGFADWRRVSFRRKQSTAIQHMIAAIRLGAVPLVSWLC